mgnify:CR=1 FL=1
MRKVRSSNGELFLFCISEFLVRMLREELQLLQEQGSLVGEVVKAMDKKKVLVKVILNSLLKNKRKRRDFHEFQVHPEGKFVVDLDKNIDMAKITPSCRVALKNDSYTLHKILPNKVTDCLRSAIRKMGIESFRSIHWLV